MSTRSVCRSGDRFAEDVGPARGAGNGARRRMATAAARCLGLVFAASSIAACSLSVPMGSLKTDDATGAIEQPVASLSPALDREDWRRARAALAVTLDPQGNGESANWRNPQSGAHGTFTAVGPPFPQHDRVCRRFRGDLVAGSTPEKRVAGSACRDGAGDWALNADVNDRTS